MLGLSFGLGTRPKFLALALQPADLALPPKVMASALYVVALLTSLVCGHMRETAEGTKHPG